MVCCTLDSQDENDQDAAGRLFSAFDARVSADATLLALAPGDRRLIEMAFYEGYTHAELAGLLHLPLGTIKTRIRASLMKMRRTLESRTGAPHPTRAAIRRDVIGSTVA